MECRISLDPKLCTHSLRFTCVEDNKKPMRTVSIHRFGGFSVANVAPAVYILFGRVTQKLNNVCHLATQNNARSSQKSKDGLSTKERLHQLASFVLAASSMVGVWYCRNNNAQCDNDDSLVRFSHDVKLRRPTCGKQKRGRKTFGIFNAVSNLGITSIKPPAAEAPEIEHPPTLIIIKQDTVALPKKPSLPKFMDLVSRASSKKLP